MMENWTTGNDLFHICHLCSKSHEEEKKHLCFEILPLSTFIIQIGLQF